jgi:SpoIIAA-like
MSVKVERTSSKVITVRVSGQLTSPQWRDAEHSVASVLATERSIALLVILEDFQGWDRGDWEDNSFQLDHDRQIERMAIVGEKKWEDHALMFCGKWFRKLPIEYFPPDALVQARVWLTSPRTADAGTTEEKGALP